MEGAFTPFDFKPFREFPDKKITRDVIQSFFDHDLLSAPSYVGINSTNEPPPFIGMDDRVSYDANVKAYLDSRALKQKVSEELSRKKRALTEKKASVFNPSLKKFDDTRTAYHKSDIGLGVYAKTLSSLYSAPEEGSFVLEQFLEASAMEQSLNFPRVESERKRVIENLTRVLTDLETKTLIAQSLAYRMGRLSFGDYYQGLKNLCQSHGIELSQTPAFENYIRYVLLSDGIKATDLFNAVEKWETQILSTLAITEEEKNLSAESEHLMLTEKLINFEMTPTEWERYKALSIDGLRLIGTSSSSLPISSPRNVFARGPGFSINEKLHPFEQFYVQADIRSRLMVGKLLTTNHNDQASNSKEYSNPNKSIESLKLDDWKLREPKVLVVGGFHTPEIAQILREKKISYVVVSPKITHLRQDSGGQAEYLSVFAREKTPLDRLFIGPKLFLCLDSVHIAKPATALKAVAIMTSLFQKSSDVVVMLRNLHVKMMSEPALSVVTPSRSQQWKESLSRGIYLIFAVQWEMIFQSSIPIANAILPGLGVGIWILQAIYFMKKHHNRAGHEGMLLSIGLVLGVPFLIPSLDLTQAILTSGLMHAIYNGFGLLLRANSVTRNWAVTWWPLASIPYDSAGAGTVIPEIDWQMKIGPNVLRPIWESDNPPDMRFTIVTKNLPDNIQAFLKPYSDPLNYVINEYVKNAWDAREEYPRLIFQMTETGFRIDVINTGEIDPSSLSVEGLRQLNNHLEQVMKLSDYAQHGIKIKNTMDLIATVITKINNKIPLPLDAFWALVESPFFTTRLGNFSIMFFPHITEPSTFQNIDKKKKGGKGVGLYITKIKLQNAGLIYQRSSGNNKTTFSVVIPIEAKGDEKHLMPLASAGNPAILKPFPSDEEAMKSAFTFWLKIQETVNTFKKTNPTPRKEDSNELLLTLEPFLILIGIEAMIIDLENGFPCFEILKAPGEFGQRLEKIQRENNIRVLFDPIGMVLKKREGAYANKKTIHLGHLVLLDFILGFMSILDHEVGHITTNSNRPTTAQGLVKYTGFQVGEKVPFDFDGIEGYRDTSNMLGYDEMEEHFKQSVQQSAQFAEFLEMIENHGVEAFDYVPHKFLMKYRAEHSGFNNAKKLKTISILFKNISKLAKAALDRNIVNEMEYTTGKNGPEGEMALIDQESNSLGWITYRKNNTDPDWEVDMFVLTDPKDPNTFVRIAVPLYTSSRGIDSFNPTTGHNDLKVVLDIISQQSESMEKQAEKLITRTTEQTERAVALLMKHASPKAPHSPNNPINRDNVQKASGAILIGALVTFGLVVGVAVMTNSIFGTHFELTSIAKYSAIILGLLSLNFLALSRLVSWVGSKKGATANALGQTGPPMPDSIPLYGRTAILSSDTDFIEFNTDTKQFNVNPFLYWLLTFGLHPNSTTNAKRFGFLVRFFTHVILTLLTVPIHEGSHVRGNPSERWAFGKQASVIAAVVGAGFLLPLLGVAVWVVPAVVGVVIVGYSAWAAWPRKADPLRTDLKPESKEISIWGAYFTPTEFESIWSPRRSDDARFEEIMNTFPPVVKNLILAHMDTLAFVIDEYVTNALDASGKYPRLSFQIRENKIYIDIVNVGEIDPSKLSIKDLEGMKELLNKLNQISIAGSPRSDEISYTLGLIEAALPKLVKRQTLPLDEYWALLEAPFFTTKQEAFNKIYFPNHSNVGSQENRESDISTEGGAGEGLYLLKKKLGEADLGYQRSSGKNQTTFSVVIPIAGDQREITPKPDSNAGIKPHEYPTPIVLTEEDGPAASWLGRHHRQYDVNQDDPAFVLFLRKWKFDNTLIKAALNIWDKSYIDPNSWKNRHGKTLGIAKSQNTRVMTDRGIVTDNDDPNNSYGIWKQNPHRIKLMSGQNFGYSDTSDKENDPFVYFGEGNQLIDLDQETAPPTASIADSFGFMQQLKNSDSRLGKFSYNFLNTWGAGWWETQVFHKVLFQGAVEAFSSFYGFEQVWAVGAAVLAVAVLFSAAHTIIEWRTRAGAPWKGVFFYRFFLSLAFSLPFLIFNTETAEIITTHLHAFHNELVLSGKMPKWMRLGSVLNSKSNPDFVTPEDLHKIHLELLEFSPAYKLKATELAKERGIPVTDPKIALEILPSQVGKTTPDTVEPTSPLEPGVMIDRFEIIELIANGEFGSVYKAFDTSSNIQVAIKVPFENVTTKYIDGPPTSLQVSRLLLRMEMKWLREATNRGAGPFPAYIHSGFDATAKRSFLAMALSPGMPLFENLKSMDAAELFNAMANLHKTFGLAHGDISQENILVTLNPEGRINGVTFVDFGLAYPLSTDARTETPLTMTPRTFAAPERKSSGATEKSDVYSMARMLCNFLSDNDLKRPDVVHLLFRALNMNPDLRPTAAELAKLFRALPKQYQGQPLPTPLGFLRKIIYSWESKTHGQTDANPKKTKSKYVVIFDLIREKFERENTVLINATNTGWTEQLARMDNDIRTALDALMEKTPEPEQQNLKANFLAFIKSSQLNFSNPAHTDLFLAIIKIKKEALVDVLGFFTRNFNQRILNLNNPQTLRLAILSMSPDSDPLISLETLLRIITFNNEEKLAAIYPYLVETLEHSESNIQTALVAWERLAGGVFDPHNETHRKVLEGVLLASGRGAAIAVSLLSLPANSESNPTIDEAFLPFLQDLVAASGDMITPVLEVLSNNWSVLNSKADWPLILDIIRASEPNAPLALNVFSSFRSSNPTPEDLKELPRFMEQLRTNQIHTNGDNRNNELDLDTFSNRTAKEEQSPSSDQPFQIAQKIIRAIILVSPSSVMRILTLMNIGNKTLARGVIYFITRRIYLLSETLHTLLADRLAADGNSDSIQDLLAEAAYDLHAHNETVPADASNNPTAIQSYGTSRLIIGRKMIEALDLKKKWAQTRTLEEALALFSEGSIEGQKELDLSAVFFKDRYSIDLEIALTGLYPIEAPKDADKKPVSMLKTSDIPAVLIKLKQCSRALSALPYTAVALNPSLAKIIIAKDGRAFLHRVDGLMLITLNSKGIGVFLHELGHALDPKIILSSGRSLTNPYRQKKPEDNDRFAERLKSFADKHNYTLGEFTGEPANDLKTLDSLVVQVYERQRDHWQVLKRTDDYYVALMQQDSSQDKWVQTKAALAAEKNETLQALRAIDQTISPDTMAKIDYEFDEALEELEAWQAWARFNGDSLDDTMISNLRPTLRMMWDFFASSMFQLINISHTYVFEVPAQDNHVVIVGPSFHGRLRESSVEWFAERARKYLSGPLGRKELKKINEESFELFDILMDESASSFDLDVERKETQEPIPDTIQIPKDDGSKYEKPLRFDAPNPPSIGGLLQSLKATFLPSLQRFFPSLTSRKYNRAVAPFVENTLVFAAIGALAMAGWSFKDASLLAWTVFAGLHVVEFIFRLATGRAKRGEGLNIILAGAIALTGAGVPFVVPAFHFSAPLISAVLLSTGLHWGINEKMARVEDARDSDLATRIVKLVIKTITDKKETGSPNGNQEALNQILNLVLQNETLTPVGFDLKTRTDATGTLLPAELMTAIRKELEIAFRSGRLTYQQKTKAVDTLAALLSVAYSKEEVKQARMIPLVDLSEARFDAQAISVEFLSSNQNKAEAEAREINNQWLAKESEGTPLHPYYVLVDGSKIDLERIQTLVTSNSVIIVDSQGLNSATQLLSFLNNTETRDKTQLYQFLVRPDVSLPPTFFDDIPANYAVRIIVLLTAHQGVNLRPSEFTNFKAARQILIQA